jgi:hypothetical protein
MIKLKNLITEKRVKRGSKITYMRQFRFGKEGKETAKVVAIKGDHVLLDNGEQLRMTQIKLKPKDYKIESVNEGFTSSQIKKAIAIAKKMSGNMTNATKKIEKLKRGLSQDSKVKDALKTANESVNEAREINIDDLLKNSKVKQLMKRLGIRGNDIEAAAKIIQHFASNPSDLRAMGV